MIFKPALYKHVMARLKDDAKQGLPLICQVSNMFRDERFPFENEDYRQSILKVFEDSGLFSKFGFYPPDDLDGWVFYAYANEKLMEELCG